MNENDSISEGNRDNLREQSSGELLRTGCVQRYVAGYFDLQRFGQYGTGGVASNLQSRDYKYITDVIVESEQRKYVVRRLTPLECSRLMGLPDFWCEGLVDENPTDEEMEFWRGVFNTYTEINGKKPKTDKQIRKWLASEPLDAERYRMYGNGIAVPCGFDVLKKINDYVELEEI